MSDDIPTQQEVDDEVHECARYGEIDTLEEMFATDDTNMININVVDEEGNCVLHKAAANGHVDMLKYLVEHKATYQLNKNNAGALTWAALNKQKDAVVYLLEAFHDEVDILLRPITGLSPLSTAYHVEAADIVDILLAHPSAAALETEYKEVFSDDDEDGEFGEPPEDEKELIEKENEEINKDAELKEVEQKIEQVSLEETKE